MKNQIYTRSAHSNLLISKFANLLIFLRSCNLLILTLVNVLMFSACSRSDKPFDGNAPKPATISSIETPSHDKAVVIWGVATDEQTSSDNLTYQVLWQANGSSNIQDSGTPRPFFFTYTLTGLSEKTTYRVWVKVRDEAGNTADYPAKEFTTPAKTETKPEPKPDTGLNTTHYIQLTTEKKVGETIWFYIDAQNENKKGVWLDLNANGKWDEGVDEKPAFDYKDYTLKAQTFRIYGKVRSLSCVKQALTALDISQNPDLTLLDIRHNKLAAIGHLAHIASLSIDSNTMLASSLPSTLTSLNINETTPLSTFQFKPFTKLKELRINSCKSISSIDLSQNTELRWLYVDGTNLTTLDLSKNTKIETLYVLGSPLTNINIQGNTVLRDVKIKLADDGKGLTGTALTNFINALPIREAGKEGTIELSTAQKTEAVVKALEAKRWKVK